MVRIALLGIEILRVDWSGVDQGDSVEWVEEDLDGQDGGWGGQQANGAHIERDYSPLSPEQRFEYVWEEEGDRSRRFGFG